jgi:hypothetical protein
MTVCQVVALCVQTPFVRLHVHETAVQAHESSQDARKVRAVACLNGKPRGMYVYVPTDSSKDSADEDAPEEDEKQEHPTGDKQAAINREDDPPA